MTDFERDESIINNERTILEGLLFYFSYIARHRKSILTITIIAAVGSVIFSIITIKLPADLNPLPNYYQASSVLIVGQGGGDMPGMLASLGINIPVGGQETDYGQLSMRVLQSRPFIDDIVKKHNIIDRYKIIEKQKTESREIVMKNSDVQYDSRNGTLVISFEATDPVFARDVVQSMVSSLQNWFMEWEGSSARQKLSAMERKIEEVNQEINRLEDEIQKFQSFYGVFSIEQLAEAQMAMITDLESQLIATEVAIRNYSGFSTLEDQELIQLQSRRDSIRDLIQQVENGEGSGVRDMPARDELPALAIEYSHLRMSHEIQMRILQNLREQYEVQKLATTGTSAFSILEPAEIPEEKSRPQRSKICIIATILGFSGSIGLALIKDLVQKVKNDPEKRKILNGNDV